MRRPTRAADAARAAEVGSQAPAPTAVVYDPTGEGLHDGLTGPVVAAGGATGAAADPAGGLGLPLAADAPDGAAVLVIPMVDGWEDALASARGPVVAEPAPLRVPAAL